VVAAALDGPPPVTVRPIGDAHARSLAVDAALAQRLRLAEACAVVDEGPGLSGSSFAAVARAHDAGRRVHFFPSHGAGPGPLADEATRALWDQARLHLCEFETKDHTGSFTGALPVIGVVLLVAAILPIVTRPPGEAPGTRGILARPARVR